MDPEFPNVDPGFPNVDPKVGAECRSKEKAGAKRRSKM